MLKKALFICFIFFNFSLLQGEESFGQATNEWENIKLLNKLIQIVCKKTGLEEENVRKTITHVTDRLGHDRRYAIDCTKIKNELNWKRNFDFETGLENTVDWYLNNKKWIENVRSGEYRNWIEKNYKER